MYLQLLLAATLATQGNTRQVEGCGLTVAVPRQWSVRTEETASEPVSCTLKLAPPDWERIRDDSEREVPDWAIVIDVFRGDLAELCRAEKLCADKTGWYFGLPPESGTVYPPVPATEIRTACCRAFRGVTGGHRVYLKDVGSIEGEPRDPYAIVLGPGRIAELTEDRAAEVGENPPSEQSPAIFDALVSSLRFEEGGSRPTRR